jgi:hypothetical protein
MFHQEPRTWESVSLSTRFVIKLYSGVSSVCNEAFITSMQYWYLGLTFPSVEEQTQEGRKRLLHSMSTEPYMVHHLLNSVTLDHHGSWGLSLYTTYQNLLLLVHIKDVYWTWFLSRSSCSDLEGPTLWISRKEMLWKEKHIIPVRLAFRELLHIL